MYRCLNEVNCIPSSDVLFMMKIGNCWQLRNGLDPFADEIN